MTKGENDKYYFEANVIGGFKYRYQFIVCGEMVIDETTPYDVSRTDRLTNYKNVELAQSQQPVGS